MAAIVTHFPTKNNFFEVYPQLTTTFSSLDPTSEEASKLMWCISLIVSPASTFANLTYSERIERATSELGISLDLEDETIQKLITTFKNLVLTKKEKFLVAWEEKLEQRQEFIDSIPYDANTYELLDKMMKQTKDMWKHYMDCLKDVQEEKEQNFGNTSDSFIEQQQTY